MKPVCQRARWTGAVAVLDSLLERRQQDGWLFVDDAGKMGVSGLAL